MASYNQVTLIGNLTKDPELRYIPSGSAVCSFGLAVNRAYTNADGEKQEDVTFIDIVCWNKLAEACSQYLQKGSPVFVEGRLQQKFWETEDGSKRHKHEVVARTVQFLGKAKFNQDEENGNGDDVPF